MDNRNQLQAMVSQFSVARLQTFLRAAAGNFRPETLNYQHFLDDNTNGFDTLIKAGEIVYDDGRRLLVVTTHTNNELTSRSGRTRQYDLAKRILKAEFYDAGIFVFHDDKGHFRFSLVVAQYFGATREFTNYRRYTYFVTGGLSNKTFINQIGQANFSSIEKVLAAFSIEAVSEEFYAAFKPHFDEIANAVVSPKVAQSIKEDFALLFVIRTIFLGFVQKKGWLGGNQGFLQEYLAEYQKQFAGKNRFYTEWLRPLFFEALNSRPGTKVAYGKAPFSPTTERILLMAPYLNGELFKEKRGVDDLELWIPDAKIAGFFDWLFQYNFTIEENTLYDEELELNPEFLGIIFERLVNKADGAVYTPRTEVDFMCRMALVKWLEPQLENSGLRVAKDDLYNLLFRNIGQGAEFDEHQKRGDFSAAELRKLIELLETVTMCDPAAGSGAFEVGMLHVLDDVLENLYKRPNLPAELSNNAPTAFERKKRIIANSLYGVEVKRWAVWINHLRLWLSLFVDMPDDYKESFKPLLPNLTFKVRVGDSLVQRLGSRTFPVQGHARLSPTVRTKVTILKQRKRDFFYNEGEDYRAIEQEELRVFEAILDEEIEEKAQKLCGLREPKEKQAAFNLGDARLTQGSLAVTDEAVRRQLEEEISELKARKQSLRDDRPFIWSIEFAEIFFAKGGFDLIIGNPPYVRQEDIADPTGQLSVADYKAALKAMVLLDFPEYFAKSAAKLDDFKDSRKPDGLSDLFTYFYVRSLRLLNHTGIHVFICSNSWLDTDYGAWLQEFLLRSAQIHYVIDNHARRTFRNADVNTIITIFSAPVFSSVSTKAVERKVRFLALKLPFEDVILAENMLAIERPDDQYQTDSYRLFSASVNDLLAEGSVYQGEKSLSQAKYKGGKWGGLYLRSPDWLATLLGKGKDQLSRLDQHALIFPGCYSGINDFFYITQDRIREYEIEAEYLMPLLKSSHDVRQLDLMGTLPISVFAVPSVPKARLGLGAQRYIDWGESQVTRQRQKTEAGIPWPQTQTVSNRIYWYSIPATQLVQSHIFMQYVANDRFYCPVSALPLVSDRAFHRIVPRDDNPSCRDKLACILNSTLSAFFTFLLGRANLGQGAFKFEASDAKRLWIISPAILDEHAVADAFSRIKVRRPLSVFEECGIVPDSGIPISEQVPAPLPDRKALDDIVFNALRLNQEERKQVYRAVCQLVWERISKAKSVTRG